MDTINRSTYLCFRQSSITAPFNFMSFIRDSATSSTLMIHLTDDLSAYLMSLSFVDPSFGLCTTNVHASGPRTYVCADMHSRPPVFYTTHG